MVDDEYILMIGARATVKMQRMKTWGAVYEGVKVKERWKVGDEQDQNQNQN